jgi:hypothetical protein
MTLGSAALITGVGSTLGAVGGFFAGSPLDGMKVGGALAMQVVAAQENTEIKKTVCKKVLDGADGAGRKFNDIADSSNAVVKNIAQGVNIAANAIGGAIQTFSEKIGDTGCKAIIDVSHKYSTMLLISYAFSTMNSASFASNDYFLNNCKGSLDNIICATESIKSMTFSSMAVAIGAALVSTAWQTYFKNKNLQKA